jgi:predicted site-specific integrase-resolvase
MNTQESLTVTEAAVIAGVREETVRRWIHSGLQKSPPAKDVTHLPVQRTRRHAFRITRTDLDAFLAPIGEG